MIRSNKIKTLWSSSAIIPNKYPATVVPNYSLAKTASSLSLFVPLHVTEQNVNFVEKTQTPKQSGYLGFDRVKPDFRDMSGSGSKPVVGEVAFQHPFKVHFCLQRNATLFYFYLGLSYGTARTYRQRT